MNIEDRRKDFKQRLTVAYTNHSDSLFRLCLYKTSSNETAKDILQETYLRYWDYLSQGKIVDSEKAFLFQIARNLIIDYYRKKKSVSLDSLKEEGFDPGDASHNKIVNEAEVNIAIETINNLDEKYKDVVYMRLIEDMPMEEIGRSLGISANTATVRFHRGMKQLEKEFK
ncbi:MAG: polymerase sigma factor, sigma-70 family [Candidatus Nomurabacteria bacterium]|nr:polymerase sigma factor, sigma-70 family [Candidatus Nomurabacteria bacterium]